MKTPPSNASPLKSAVEEIDFLRHSFRATLDAYGAAVEGELAKLREAVATEAGQRRMPVALIRDARDIITLIRTLELRPEKGRRRDLKKIEAVVGDLQGIIEAWHQ